MRGRWSVFVASSGVLAALAWSARARAVDVVKVGDAPLRLDVTETAIVSQRFEPREGEKFEDQGYGAFINRLNAALSYKRFTLGTRLDGSIYWRKPEDRTLPASIGADATSAADLDAARATELTRLQRDGASRFPTSLYPAKLWATYKAPGLEVTAGDAYVQLGRGLVLSMRKIDELGADNTVRGGKVAWQADPIALTLVAGLANPSRVDEATGRALFLPSELPGDIRGAQPLYASDRLVGAQIEAGRGTPVVLGTRGVRLTRCAPYSYDANGRVVTDALDAPIGSCTPSDTATYLGSLPDGNGPVLKASEVDVASQSLEIPKMLGKSTKLYVEAAVQRWKHDDVPLDPNTHGNALYAALNVDIGPVTNTIEVKSYRNFYPLAGGVNTSRAAAFSTVVYSAPPTTEPITQDSMFNFFNACVDGGRLRSDVRATDDVLLYASGAYYFSKSEVPGSGCDDRGRTITKAQEADTVHNRVYDGFVGTEIKWDSDKSHLFAQLGGRDDRLVKGGIYYEEAYANYTLEMHVKGPVSAEITGKHRLRYEENQNVDSNGGGERPWVQGENYLAVKIVPKWILTQGFEYTTLVGQPTTYFNGGLVYKFTSDSNIKLFGGQQRGGLKCVSGVCRIFPAYAGARAELTFRF